MFWNYLNFVFVIRNTHFLDLISYLLNQIIGLSTHCLKADTSDVIMVDQTFGCPFTPSLYHLCDRNTLIADFKLPMWCHWRRTWEDTSITNNQEPRGATGLAHLEYGLNGHNNLGSLGKTHITYFLLKQTSWITYKKTKFDLFQNVIHFHPINIHCSKIYLILKYKFPNNDFVIDIVRCPF